MNQDDEDVLGGIDDTVFQDYTHPKGLDFTHIPSWETFAQDLTKACQSVFPQHPGEYEGVHALLMNWVDDDLGTETELFDMHTLFRDHFNYSSEIWKIPSKHSEDALERKLSEVKVQFGGENRFLIVYYGGHGRLDPSSRSIWQAHCKGPGRPKSPTLSWSTLQPMLQRALCDVLIILDCCYAGSAARTDINGTNELLAACGRETTTVGVTDRSFTRNLLRKIESFQRQPFTVNELYKRLINDRKRMTKTPQYAPLSGRVRSSIVLAPMKPDIVIDDLRLSVQSSPESGSNSSVPSTSALNSLVPSSGTGVSGLSSPSEGPRVLIALSIAPEANVPEIEQWKHWLSTDAPDDIRRLEVTLETAYVSHSTLILASVPISVWCHLPDTSAYRFVDFIRSGNLSASEATQSDKIKEISTIEEKTKASASWSVFSDEGYQSVANIMFTDPELASSDLMTPPSITPQQPTLVDSGLGTSGTRITAKDLPSARHSSQTLTSAPPPTTDFTYDSCPLTGSSDLRVFTIRHGSFDEPIVGTLVTTSLTKTTNAIEGVLSYEALSYCWGSEEASREVEIYTNGRLKPFRITPNLYAALNHLRLPDRSRDFWIDSICINQNDNNEKNAQVRLMADIFAGATSVCVWLGVASADSTLALSFISRIVSLDDLDRFLVDPQTEKQWAALLSLMKRNWFSRQWAAQGISSAVRAIMYCGDAYVEWSDFADAVSLLEAIESDSRGISESHMGAIRLAKAPSKLVRKSNNGQVLERLFSLEALVLDFCDFQAPQPHDAIYAVLNLAKGIFPLSAISSRETLPQSQSQVTTESTDHSSHKQNLTKLATRRFERAVEEHSIVIDYEKPFFDVCKEFLQFTIKSYGFLDIICRPWVPEDSIPDSMHPSWLLTISKMAWRLGPDGNYRRVNADTLVGPPGLAKRNYNASGSFKVTDTWKFGEGPKVCSMYVEGFVIDSIKQKKPYAADGIILNEWLIAGGWTDMSSLPPDEFWRTLVADRGPNGVSPPTFYPRAFKAALNQSVKGGHISTNTLVHNGKSTIVEKFLRRVQEVIMMRRLVITEHDFLGLAPEMSKKRDLICILYGCSVPVALRRMVDPVTDEEYFTIIGECYVHGIMDGEAFALARSRSGNGQITKKIFELR